MRRFSKRIILFLVIILFLLLLIHLINKNKFGSIQGSTPMSTNLKASMFTNTDTTTPYISFSYTNPSSFGPPGTNALKPIFYFVTDGVYDTRSPSTDNITTQYYLNVDSNGNKLLPIITDISNNYNQPGAIVTGTLNKNDSLLDPSKFSRVPGAQYIFGIAIQSDNLAGWSGNRTLPYIYSGFQYITLIAPKIYKCSSDPDSRQCVEDTTGNYIDKGKCDNACNYSKPWKITLRGTNSGGGTVFYTNTFDADGNRVTANRWGQVGWDQSYCVSG